MDNGRKEELSKALVELESRISRSTKALMEGEFKDLVQVGIVRELLSGSRTSSELVETIYGVRRGDEGFQSHYTRIRREIADLESKGFVSRRLFGRNRPYRLTQLAVARLTRMANVNTTWGAVLIPRRDLLIYSVAMLLVGFCSLVSVGIVYIPSVPWFLLLLSSAFLTGVAFTRFIETLARVV